MGLFSKIAAPALGIAGDIYGANVASKDAKKQREFEAQQAGLSLDEQKREFDLSNAARAAELSTQNIQFNTQIGESRRISDARKAAYADMLNRGTAQQTQAESQLMGETANASPELLQAEKDIQSGTAESMQAGQNEINANLAKQGVRGGQAATQLRRGMGEMAMTGQRDINTMKADDAARRNAIRAAYLASKGSQGASASLSAPTY